MSVDLKQFERMKGVLEAQELMGTWEFWIDSCPVNPIEVKVWKNSNGTYTGLTNYLIKNPQQASAYRSVNPAPTMDTALKMAISGFLAYFKPELAGDTEFIKEGTVRF